MHNSTAEDGKQGHTISLIAPHTEDIDIMDREVVEIVEVVMPTMDTSDQSTDRNNTMMTKNPGITGEPHNFTTLPANTFRTVNIQDQWLKRYISQMERTAKYVTWWKRWKLQPKMVLSGIR